MALLCWVFLSLGLRAQRVRTGTISMSAGSAGNRQRQGQQPHPIPLALPPAASRELAAEVMAAASLLTRSSARLVAEQESQTRSLILLSIRHEPSFQQLAGEVISHISSGPRAGTSWVRPLALRTVSNVSLATAAERFDPTIGWLGTRDAEADGEGPVPSHLHLFSPLAPAIFVPTTSAEEVPPALGLAIRSLSQAHAAAAEEAHVDLLRQSDTAAAHAPERADAQALRAFMVRLAEPGAVRRTDESGGDGSSSYDPLSRF